MPGQFTIHAITAPTSPDRAACTVVSAPYPVPFARLAIAGGPPFDVYGVDESTMSAPTVAAGSDIGRQPARVAVPSTAPAA